MIKIFFSNIINNFVFFILEAFNHSNKEMTQKLKDRQKIVKSLMIRKFIIVIIIK